jgi:hypothetical protein
MFFDEVESLPQPGKERGGEQPWPAPQKNVPIFFEPHMSQLMAMVHNKAICTRPWLMPGEALRAQKFGEERGQILALFLY